MIKETINYKSQDKNKEIKKDNEVLSFFLIMFPSIIIVAIGMLIPKAWWVMIALIVYQAIILKQFLDNYYGKDLE